MANGVVVQNSQGADPTAAQMVAYFSSGGSISMATGRYVSRVVLVSGEQPSYAFVSMPLNASGDEVSMSVALKSSGPAGAIQLRTRGVAGYSQNGVFVPLVCGTLVRYSHHFEEDSAIASIFDDKWWLSKMTIFGRMVWDPATQNHYFDAEAHTTFNENGPNCMDSPYGPRFAPSWRTGYRQQYNGEDTTQPVPGSATVRARRWTVADIISYLRDFTFNVSNRPSFNNVDYGNTVLPDFIVWDDTAGSLLGDTRTVNNFDLHNKNLLRSLQATARKAGPYDLYMKPQGLDKSELVFLNMSIQGNAPVSLFMPDNFQNITVANLMAPNIICGGYVNEDIVNEFDDVCICGDPPLLETFGSTAATDLGAKYIVPAWTLQDETDFQSFIHNLAPIPDSQYAFELATKIWPLVYCGYRFNNTLDAFAGTKWAGIGGGYYPKFEPALLTGYNENAQNPRAWQPRDIVVEVSVPTAWGGDGTWHGARRLDSLQLTPDKQIFMLPALRDAGADATDKTWTTLLPPSTGEGWGSWRGDKLKPTDIRLSLVVRGNTRITGRAGMGDDDPNAIRVRIDQNSPKTTWLSIADDQDYVDDLRRGSHPNGTGMPAAFDDFPDYCTTGHELFSDANDRLPNHATARLLEKKRIDYSGQVTLPVLNPAMTPGLSLQIQQANGIQIQSITKSITFDGDAPQMTTVEFAPSDDAVIYDIPYLASVPRATGNAKFSMTESEDRYSQREREDQSGYGEGDDSQDSLRKRVGQRARPMTKPLEFDTGAKRPLGGQGGNTMRFGFSGTQAGMPLGRQGSPWKGGTTLNGSRTPYARGSQGLLQEAPSGGGSIRAGRGAPSIGAPLGGQVQGIGGAMGQPGSGAMRQAAPASIPADGRTARSQAPHPDAPFQARPPGVNPAGENIPNGQRGNPALTGVRAMNALGVE